MKASGDKGYRGLQNVDVRKRSINTFENLKKSVGTSFKTGALFHKKKKNCV